jgi:hypothetical protein
MDAKKCETRQQQRIVIRKSSRYPAHPHYTLILNGNLPAGVQLRKTSVTAKDPQENGKDNTFKRPQLRPVPPKEETKPPKETLPPVKLNSVAERQKNEAMKKPPIQRLPSKDEEIDRVSPSVDAKSNRLLREGSIFDLFVRSKGDSGDEERFGQGGEHAEALADAGAATHAAPSAQDARKRQDETPHTETARTNRTTQVSIQNCTT